MEISAVNNIYITDTGISKSTENQQSEVSAEEVKVAETPDESADQITQNPDEEMGQSTIDNGHQRGVIRNLLAGHFKGVADVRLRINFNDELSALEQEEMSKAIDKGIADLTTLIDSAAGAALGSSEIDEVTSATISDALDTLKANLSQLAEEDPMSPESLVEKIQNSYEDFAASLAPAADEHEQVEPIDSGTVEIATIADEVEAEEPVADNSESVTEEPTFSMEQFLADLTITFNNELDNLKASLLSINLLPEITEPNGNGRAFDKFLTIYNDLKADRYADSPLIDTLS